METVTLSPGAEQSGLCVMLKGVLDECAARHGGRLPWLGTRLGIDASDAGEQATLIFGGGRCTIEDGLTFPDLLLRADSDLLPRLTEVPLRLGVPWLFSPPGLLLLASVVRGQARLPGLIHAVASPLRTTRATLDVLVLCRLLSEG